ncbi:MAG: glutathione S-transferase [Alphaproteobacteria bacterium]|nr:glutathione S-transferase [Alphaproteobacteria bacterium]
MTRPILYSFRRCPYAMRARLAIRVSGVVCELREIVLRDKAPEFIEASPKATVPVLVVDGMVIDESLDIMRWALVCADPNGWLELDGATFDRALALIAKADTDFKSNLDRYKYASRFAPHEGVAARDKAAGFLQGLNQQLAPTGHLFGHHPSLPDMAIAPFVRQFANVDPAWFDGQPWPHLLAWLNRFLASDDFIAIMLKYPKWRAGDPVTLFPERPRDAP